VTPWIECADPPTSAPRVQLQVNGVPTDGIVEVIGLSYGRSPPAPIPVPTRAALPGAPIEVPVDVISELWIVGGACALAWTIDLVGSDVLDAQVNPALDTGYAAQNRFSLVLAPYGGRSVELQAVLTFPNLAVRATWPIRVLPFELPVAQLQSDRDREVPVEGCDVTLTLGNRLEARTNPCDDDMSADLTGEVRVRRGEPLTFALPGWDIMTAIVTCGRISGRSFVAVPASGCDLEPDPNDSVTFELPVDGEWTLAISACALQAGSEASNRICGTWYSTVEVLD
jgi:hypothetical protein